MSDDVRFGGIRRLFGVQGAARLQKAHVGVVGLGGVGSWSVEALARSGIGSLTLVDLDDICVTNINRQLHAVEGEIGRPKVEAMARRVQAIHPGCVVRQVHSFFTTATAEEVLAPSFDYILDAIDNPEQKALLIARCRARGIPVVVVGGAGGRQQAPSLHISDLAFATHDRLLTELRSVLRKEHGFPAAGQPFGVECVYSVEPRVYPTREGGICARRESGSTLRLDCEQGYGTACFVTGAFGFAAAGHIVNRIAAAPA